MRVQIAAPREDDEVGVFGALVFVRRELGPHRVEHLVVSGGCQGVGRHGSHTFRITNR